MIICFYIPAPIFVKSTAFLVGISYCPIWDLYCMPVTIRPAFVNKTVVPDNRPYNMITALLYTNMYYKSMGKEKRKRFHCADGCVVFSFQRRFVVRSFSRARTWFSLQRYIVYIISHHARISHHHYLLRKQIYVNYNNICSICGLLQ